MPSEADHEKASRPSAATGLGHTPSRPPRLPYHPFMPYQWLPAPSPRHLRLWPHRSLSPDGFAAFIAATALLTALPLLTFLGQPALWFIFAFAAAALTGVWLALRRSWRDGEITEDLTLWPDRVTLTRRGPRGRRQEWEANPYWVRVILHPTTGPVPNYLTLQGGPREVEIGAFLSVEERAMLHRELAAALSG